MKLKKDRIAVEKIKKTSILSATTNQNYDYEKFLFKVCEISDSVLDRELVGKTIIKQEQKGIPIEYKGKEYIIITEDDIIATI